MRRTWSHVVGLAFVVASARLLHAQMAMEDFLPFPGTQDLITLDINGLPLNAQASGTDRTKEPSSALESVARFLELRPDQFQSLRQLLQARQEALAPLREGLAEHERRLHELLEGGGSPPEVGQVVIEIHLLQGQVIEVQQNFLTDWENLLDSEQRQRWEAVRLAARLQPVLPAFLQLQLL